MSTTLHSNSISVQLPNESDLVIERCPYMLRCRNFFCKLFHPDESAENYRKRIMKNLIYTEAQKIIKNPTLLKQYFEKSKFCKYKDTCKMGKTCTYAHNLSEYKPPQCFYKEYCTTRDCPLFHPWDKVDTFLEQRNHDQLPKPEIVVKAILPRPKTFAETVLVPEPKTDLCPNVGVDTKCSDKDCTLAHTLWELKPKKCTGTTKDCRCLLFHHGEDKLDYFIRSGIAKLIQSYHV